MLESGMYVRESMSVKLTGTPATNFSAYTSAAR